MRAQSNSILRRLMRPARIRAAQSLDNHPRDPRQAQSDQNGFTMTTMTMAIINNVGTSLAIR